MLLPANKPALRLWQLCQTQWRVNGGALVGLDYPAMLQVAALHGIVVTPTLFQKIQQLECYELTRKVT